MPQENEPLMKSTFLGKDKMRDESTSLEARRLTKHTLSVYKTNSSPLYLSSF